MILYKKSFADGAIKRPSRTMNISIDELPSRPVPRFKSSKDKVKFIKSCEAIVRKSLEYKEYIKFLRENVDMNQCAIFKNVKNEPGKHYRIEIHHEPFTLYDIVETVIDNRILNEESFNAIQIADEVMDLHYRGMVGLIPLSVTMHELVHNGRIFIPLSKIYQNYIQFVNEYEAGMSENLKSKIEAKISLSEHTEDYVSDCLDVEIVYMNVDGVSLPEVPDAWKNAILTDTSKIED